MKFPRLLPVLKDTFAGWWQDKAPMLGAALAYYTVLALAPVVILTAPIAGAIFHNSAAARHRIVMEFEELIGKPGADAVGTVLNAGQGAATPGVFGTTVGLIVLMFGASGVFVNLQESLDAIWHVAIKPGKAAFLGVLRKRFLSFAMVLGICFLLLVSLIISAGLASLRDYAQGDLKQTALAWTIAQEVVSLTVITVLFAMIYKILPDVTVPWKDVWMGAAIAAGLFSLGRFAIGTYLGRSLLVRSYGAAGSLVALLVWVYYSAQILYLGAEFTRAWSARVGDRIVPEPAAQRVNGAGNPKPKRGDED
ncbi:MAG TPA: YihY/virulence factor BrkB family protein [Tepidisphaeraceae bacterium]|nr:YihY/virulence factor BrkB family protein [Tepidisphaeraceae bacterium]